ncbi:hypothetical protein AwWohl_03260 [Gammaproteobacteria bacterium]|nr:hypothetical protein AwWohl_03260 [Gammaproteobacteria bacterium]
MSAMPIYYFLCATAIIALITFGLRALPFILAKQIKQNLAIRYLGIYLPPAIMALLVLSTLKIELFKSAGAIPIYQLIGIAVVIGLHLYFKNVFISILGGTAFYMLLINGI